jgi:hypothetical protein
MIIRGDAAHRQRVRERLLSRAVVDLHGPRPVDDAPCWFFSQPNGKRTGYAQFSVGKQKGLHAHRVAYELWCGEIPPGAEIDHLCHPGDGSCPPETCPHRRCVNPAHLSTATSQANTLRGATLAAANAAKTHCDKGHEFTEENTYVDRRGGRYCRACGRDKDRRMRAAAGMRSRLNRTHCNSGKHPWTEENIYTESGRKKCRPCRNERVRDRRRGIQGDAAA